MTAIKWTGTLIACDETQAGSQHCYISRRCLEPFGLKLGDYVVIAKGEICVLCKTIAVRDEQNDIINYDDTVTLKHGISSDAGCNILKLSKRQKARRLSVTVVVDSVDDLETWENQGPKYRKYVRSILTQYTLAAECVVDCANHPLHKLMRIHRFLVRVDGGESNVAYSLSSDGEVTTSVMSRDEYDDSNRFDVPAFGIEKPLAMLRAYCSTLLFSDTVETLACQRLMVVLLVGPEGGGKKSMVEKLAKDGFVLLHRSCTEFADPHPGKAESQLDEVFEQASIQGRHRPCILYLENIDSICQQDSHARLKNRLVSLLYRYRKCRSRFLVLASTSQPLALDRSISQSGRFEYEVCIALPTTQSRLGIFKRIFTSNNISIENADMDKLALKTHGCTGSDINSIFQQTLDQVVYSQKACVQVDDFLKTLNSFTPSLQRGNGFILTDFRHTDWTQIGGLKKVIWSLQNTIDMSLKRPWILSESGLPPIRGTLLYGPPGCCKTTLARALASYANATFISLSPADVFSQYVGDSEKYISEAFQNARFWSPSIIFIDEIDALVGSRSRKSKGEVHEKVLSTLLAEMDGIGFHKYATNWGRSNDQMQVFHDKQDDGAIVEPPSVDNVEGGLLVVATTNKPDLIDNALLRPGRFDHLAYIGPPDSEERKDILRVLTKSTPLSEDDLEFVASETERYSGADLEFLYQTALANAKHDKDKIPQRRHFVEALQRTKPSISEECLSFFNTFNDE